VADALQLTLLPAEATAIAQPSTQDASAYDLFLHAEYLRNKAYALMTPVGLGAALDLYTQALVRDPKFALAYAKRSDVESFLFWRGDSKLSRQQLAAAALRDAEQALALQPGLADAHVAMANYHRLVFRDFPGALLEYQKALITRPNDTNAMIWIASDSSRQGRWQQSIQWYNAAFAHDPNNHETAHYLAYTYWEARQYAAAERMFERAVALDPDDGFATWDFAQFILYTSGDIARAMSLVRSVDDPRLRLGYADLLTWQRNYRDAIGVMRGIPDVPSTFTFGSGPKTLVLGDMYWRAGEVTQARPLLLKGRAQIQADIAAQPANFVGLAYMWDNLAMADAELGDQDAALTAAHKALAIAPTSKDHVLGLNMMRYVAQVYAAMGRADLAVPMLKQLLATPGAGDAISPVSLRLDPAWDPIRRDPRFEALLKQQAKTNVLASS
ncbi:MAG: tetratricopeptide repeat protein, partial [Gammaproteobacteria bacterium]|nr:tetratricopeptide repeat protein [Gammaproteobacteria bacterium]